MGIILPQMDQKVLDFKIPTKQKRSLGYLLFELAGYKDFERIISRLNQMAQKRMVLAKTKEGNAPLEPEEILKELRRAYELSMKKYDTLARGRKIVLKTPDWNPEDCGDRYFTYFQWLLKKRAEEIIAASGKEEGA